jgi:GntR family transcriptional regulator, transcriptional repressor for pyruvate dehydrogenase complex
MSLFAPVNSPKITDLIIEQIRSAILSREIKTGDKLPAERDLVNRFKASRIAVREALKSLEASGFIVIRPGSGIFVSEIDSKQMSESLYSILRIQNVSLDQITEARLILEPQVAKLAAQKITPEDLGKLKDNIEATAMTVKSGIVATSENIEFHALLAHATQNTVLALTMRTMLEVAREMTLARTENEPKRVTASRYSLACHKQIVSSLERRDSARVYDLMHEHIVRIQRDLKKAMSGRTDRRQHGATQGR